MLKYYVRPTATNRFSRSATLLAEMLGGKRTQLQKRLKDPRNSVIINWGNSQLAEIPFGYRLNGPTRVSVASNKLKTFKQLDGKTVIPCFSTSKEYAKEHLEYKEWNKVVCRTKLTGHSGEGIVIAETVDQIVDAPLYVQYIPKSQEFRVHVFKGEVIFCQEKRRSREHEVNKQIRTHDNGWVFCFKDVVLPTNEAQLAIDAVGALGLDFGAVDIVYSKKQNKSYVLEVNTAPGLCETSARLYADAIQRSFA